MSLLLITAANAAYLDKITPYLHTIAAHGQAFDRRVLVSVGCTVAMPPELASIEAIGLPAALARGHTGNSCIQQGCFLDVLGAAPDDVLIFTDGDIRLQRGPTADELAWMRALPADTIALGWNGGSRDTLETEAGRIGLTPKGRGMFADVLGKTVYNVGVIICRAQTYQRIYARYLALWDDYYPRTSHYAANQFLLCACAHQLGLCVWELGPQIHTHGHFTFPAGIADEGDGTLRYRDDLVLFRHHWMC